MWESIEKKGDELGGRLTTRMSVPGGWIYKVLEWGSHTDRPWLRNSITMVFVPEPKKKDNAK